MLKWFSNVCIILLFSLSFAFLLWQIASACWELYCLEHGIHADGTMCQDNNLDDNDSSAFFCCCQCPTTKLLKCVPRVVLVDLEPIPIDEIRTGCYRSLFDPNSLITGKEDAASNFARGYNSLGRELIDVTLERIRRAAENSASLQGFITFRSIGGGTGSGFGTLIQEKISDNFGKVSRLEFNIFPSPKWVRTLKYYFMWSFVPSDIHFEFMLMKKVDLSL